MRLTDAQLAKFDKDGFLVLENFFSPTKLLNQANELIEKIVSANPDLNQVHNFPFLSCNESTPPTKEDLDYFMSSADQIKLFTNMPMSDVVPADDFNAKMKFIRKNGNRLGHALHALDPVFKEFTFSKPIQDIYRSFGWKKPIVCQSMYIFKTNFSDSSDHGHQAATYVHVEPPECLISMWFAIMDNTESNGCLQFIPGSHKQGLDTKFIRNPDEDEFNHGKQLIYTSKPVTYRQEQYVSMPIKRGSAILMNSQVVHKSLTGGQSQARDVYAFHVYDAEQGQFEDDNWMEYSGSTFLPLYNGDQIIDPEL